MSSAKGSILCADKAGATADWDVDSAYRAQKYSLPEPEQEAFSQAQQDWIEAVNRSCRLIVRQPAYSSQQRQCVLNAYNAKANALRARLRGDALAEARLTPEQRAEIQNKLIELAVLDGPADGQFGPMTRDAIRRYQEKMREPQTAFLSESQRTRLMQGGGEPPPKPEAAEADNQCKSSDPNKRLVGCTQIIDDKGKGYSVALEDAYDGRCWAYNDLGQFQRATDDCRAAITRNPRHAYAYNNLGWALAGLGDQRALSTPIQDL